MGQPETRSVILVVCAILSFAITIFVMITSLRATNIEDGPTDVGVGLALDLHTQNLVATRNFPGERIVMLGDSTVIAYPLSRSVPDNLRRLLRRKAPRKTLVIPIATPGMSVLEYYSFADHIVENGADQVVFPINLASFSDDWRSEFTRRDAIGWMPMQRLPDLMTRPFHALNLTFDRILFYIGIVQLGLDREWHRLGKEQARAVHGVDALRHTLYQANPRLMKDGLPTFRLPYQKGNPSRPNRHFAESIYGGAMEGILPTHPVVQIFAGALEIYEEAGIRVLAYAIPMNVEHFEGLGLDMKSGTPETIKMLRTLVESRGGKFIDLHRMFPDKGFKDLGGHFLQEDGYDGAMLLARRLVPELLRGYSQDEPVPAGRPRSPNAL